MNQRAGQQLGNYRLIRLIGQGGFAEVYLGEHIYLNTQAAIKVLHTQIVEDNRESFLAEARTIAGLVHPHIVRVLDFGIENTTPFLVMDYAPNGTLRQRYPRGTLLPVSTIVPYVKQVADALQYAHNAKLIHRDIKPENMLLERNNAVLLSDFGIATIARTSRVTTTKDIAGTVLYMAPEQLQGKPGPASDQYALGIVIYEWLTGGCPFTGAFTEVATQHIIVPPPPLREKVPTIPQDVERVVLTALAKDPQQRFVNMRALANALDQAANGNRTPGADDKTFIHPSSATPTILPTPVLTPFSIDTPAVLATPGRAAITEPPVAALPGNSNTPHVPKEERNTVLQGRYRISRRVLVAGMVGLAAASGGLVWLALAHEQTTQIQASSSTSPSANATIPSHVSTSPSVPAQPTPRTPSPGPSPSVVVPSTPIIYRGHSDKVFTAAWSPNSTRVASAGIGATVHVWDAASGSHVLIYNGQDNSSPPKVYSVAWSHDGTRIASAHEDGTVQMWNATSGTLLATYRGHAGHVNSVAWSPGDTRIASGGHDATAKVWDVASGNLLFTFSNHSNFVNAVTWSPDGSHIASASGDTTVQVWDASNGNNLFTYRGHADQVEAVAWSPDGTKVVSGSLDNTAQVWSATSANTFHSYRGHSNWVLGVSWSSDNTRVVSGSQDTTAQIWNAATGNTVHSYRGHADVVEGVAWSPDGSRITSASDDRTVQVWGAS